MDVNKAVIAQYVVQMQNGDGQAFEKLYNATNQSGYFTALKILKDEDEAQDVLQDSYITVLEKINDVQNPESFVSWFHQIVANRAKKYLLKKKPSLFASNDEEQEYTEFIPDEDEIWQPEKNVDEDDVRRQVIEIVERLSDEKRTCVILYYYNEMSVADIAQSVGASENTVKARLFQARKDIRKEVEKLGKKNIALRGVAPISLVLWALRMASKADGAKFAAGPAAVAVMEGATAAASSGAAVSGVVAGTAAAGAVQSVAATGGGLVAKIAAMTVAQKVIVGVVTAAVVAGAATGTAAIVRNAKDEPETTTEAVEAFADITTTELFDGVESFTDRVETESQTEEEKTEPATEPTATTAVSITTQTETNSTSHNQTVTSSATTSVSTQREYTLATRASSTGTTQTQKESTTSATTTKKETTTIASATTTTQPTSTSTGSDSASQGTQPWIPSPSSKTTTTKPTTTTTTTKKEKGTATINVNYSVADEDDSGTVTFSIEEGSAITEALIESKVMERLQGKYSGDIIVSPLAAIDVPSAEAKTYSFDVDVFID